MTVLALKSNIEIGSPKYRILSGCVLISSVILLAKSLDTFLPMSLDKALKRPPSAKPIAESTDAPMANPPAAPAPTISLLTMSFSNGDFILPLTTGAPNVFDCIIP